VNRLESRPAIWTPDNLPHNIRYAFSNNQLNDIHSGIQRTIMGGLQLGITTDDLFRSIKHENRFSKR
jgi:hypothetical protein